MQGSVDNTDERSLAPFTPPCSESDGIQTSESKLQVTPLLNKQNKITKKTHFHSWLSWIKRVSQAKVRRTWMIAFFCFVIVIVFCFTDQDQERMS